MIKTVDIERTIEDIDLEYGLLASVDVTFEVLVDVFGRDDEVGITEDHFDINGHGSLTFNDINVYDQDCQLVSVVLSDEDVNKIHEEAEKRFEKTFMSDPFLEDDIVHELNDL